MEKKSTDSAASLLLRTTLSFLILSPVCTYGLLLVKGFPSFAAGHEVAIFIWVYQVTWAPALGSGLLLSSAVLMIRPRIGFFIHPYDLGRCVSLGAIAGALAEALSTWGYRAVSHRSFSSFWIGGAMIAGSIAGACITSVLLFFLSKKSRA